MERKTSFGSSSSPSVASSDKHGSGKGSSSPGKSSSSSSSGLFSSVFPPASKVMGRDSGRFDFFEPSKKHESAGGISQGSSGKGNSFISKDLTSIYKGQETDPCLFSSSLYYGGQDFCASPPGSHTYRPTESYNKDVEDDSASSRGNWWEGSLYY